MITDNIGIYSSNKGSFSIKFEAETRTISEEWISSKFYLVSYSDPFKDHKCNQLLKFPKRNKLIGFTHPNLLVMFNYDENGYFEARETFIKRYMFDGIRNNTNTNILFLHGVSDKVIPWVFITSQMDRVIERDIRLMDYNFHDQEFEFFEPFLKFYLIFYNSDGSYRIDPQLLSDDICIQKEQYLLLVPSTQEEISTLCFTNKDQFLCVTTI
jgi:hypothetical protein